VWSCAVTKLHGSAKWTSHYLYVMDIYSRYAVGWLPAERGSAALGERPPADTVVKQRVIRDRLTIHADNGSFMAYEPVAFLLADLGVTKSHSRLLTSNDNPYREAQLRTLKYRPGLLDRFANLAEARVFCRQAFGWYDTGHRHSGIAWHIPHNVPYGHAEAVHTKRTDVAGRRVCAYPGPDRAKVPRTGNPAYHGRISKPAKPRH
jgi:putative transposase